MPSPLLHDRSAPPLPPAPIASCLCLQQWDAAEALLYICRRLWGQPFVAPVYSLLLHRWLLLNKDAGGQLQRQKHVNVLVSGPILPLPFQDPEN